jgi:tRNA(fMet)-specific endonuclease VapC
MILLDTDHVSILKFAGNERRERLQTRLRAIPPEEAVAVSIITVEEQMRGWLSSIAKERQAIHQVSSYRDLAGLFEFFAFFTIVPFDLSAAQRFDSLRASKVRIGTPDLKIAAIALVNDALLLTANRRDFEQVPGLRFENWMDPA